jgi:uncharacterized delta-60 repeat protein
MNSRISGPTPARARELGAWGARVRFLAFSTAAMTVLVCRLAQGQPLVVDPDFAPVLINRVGLDYVTLHPLAGGRLLAEGSFSFVEGVRAAGLARLEASGARDATFTFAGPALDSYGTVIPLADGRFLVMRLVRGQAGPPSIVRLERFLADGALDTGYAGLELPGGSLRHALLAPDGSVIIAGSFTEVGGQAREGLARLTADGTLDSSFAPTLAGPNSVVTSVVVAGDGAVTVTGYRPGTSTTVVFFMRFRADGTRDATFVPDATRLPNDNWPSVLAALPGGKVLVTSRDNPLFRLAADGSVDATFAPQLPTNHGAKKAVALSGGRVLAEFGVDRLGYVGPPETLLVLAENGTLERDLGAAFSAATVVQLAGMTADGTVLVRHGRWDYSPPGNSYTIDGIARVALDGTIVAQLAIDLGSDGWVDRMMANDDGSVFISGAFDRVNGIPRPGIARLLGSGAIDRTFAPQTATTPSLVQPDGRLLVYVAIPENEPEIDPARRVRRLLADGSIDPSLPNDSPLASADFQLLGFDRNGRVIATKLVPEDSPAPQTLQLFNPDGTVAQTLPARFTSAESVFVPAVNPPPPINRIFGVEALEDGGLLLDGWFDHVNDQPWPKLVRLKADGSIDTDYRPLAYPDDILRDAQLLRGGRALVTLVDTGPGVGHPIQTVRLLADGTEDPTFRPHPDEWFSQVSEQSDGSLLGVGPDLQRWSADGVRDLSIGTLFGGYFDYPFLIGFYECRSGRILPDGRIVVAGQFSVVDGVLRTGLARLLPAPVAGISLQPESATTTAGRGTWFQVATGDPENATYQWQINGVDIAGETRALLILDSVTPAQAGAYRAVVRIGGQTFVSEPATLTVAPNTARLANFSARSRVEPGRPPQIAGFVAAGTAPREVLLRAVGPSLPMSGFLGFPEMRLCRGQDVLAAGTSPFVPEVLNRTRRTGAFSLNPWDMPPYYSDTALAADLSGGIYTIQTTSRRVPAGISLFEFYDAAVNPAPGFLCNVSLRGHTAPGNDTLIGGFVVAGEGPITLLLRAVGPELANWGVPDPLADPRLTLFSGSIAIGSNDDWTRPIHAAPLSVAEAAARTGAFPLDPDGRSAALVAQFERGTYTVHATGAGDTSGEVLLEIYVVED